MGSPFGSHTGGAQHGLQAFQQIGALCGAPIWMIGLRPDGRRKQAIATLTTFRSHVSPHKPFDLEPLGVDLRPKCSGPKGPRPCRTHASRSTTSSKARRCQASSAPSGSSSSASGSSSRRTSSMSTGFPAARFERARSSFNRM